MRRAGIKKSELDLLIGGPPCQPFSKSAFWAGGQTKRLDDPRADTIGFMMDLVEAALPKTVVIENVRGIGYKDKDEGLELLRSRLRQINKASGTKYSLEVTYLQAAEYGVPQLRERAFMVAFRSGAQFVPPEPVTGPRTAASIPSVWDALGKSSPSKKDIPTLALRGKWAGLVPSIPEGENYLWHTARGGGQPLFGWRTRYWSFLLKLAKRQPSWTIQATPGPATGPFHWDNRLLSISEMSRLQTFPRRYKFAGDYNAARRQIGNAVPPALAEAVARRIRSILCEESYSPKLALAVRPRPDVPLARQPTSVPASYLNLVGDHDDHPGTGMGPAALRLPAELRTPGISDGRRENTHPHPFDLGDQQGSAA
jgi:DNA (cytosine-5)-methyltransferase 1